LWEEGIRFVGHDIDGISLGGVGIGSSDKDIAVGFTAFGREMLDGSTFGMGAKLFTGRIIDNEDTVRERLGGVIIPKKLNPSGIEQVYVPGRF
jgi:hypothetical protein